MARRRHHYDLSIIEIGGDCQAVLVCIVVGGMRSSLEQEYNKNNPGVELAFLVKCAIIRIRGALLSPIAPINFWQLKLKNILLGRNKKNEDSWYRRS